MATKVSDALLSTVNTGFATEKAAAAQKASQGNDLGQDTFLTMMLTQMKNQDPTKPMDSSQYLAQLAQFSTVSGIEKLNTTVAGLNSQFVQMQALQGASLVGRDVILPGDKLSNGLCGE